MKAHTSSTVFSVSLLENIPHDRKACFMPGEKESEGMSCLSLVSAGREQGEARKAGGD